MGGGDVCRVPAWRRPSKASGKFGPIRHRLYHLLLSFHASPLGTHAPSLPPASHQQHVQGASLHERAAQRCGPCPALTRFAAAGRGVKCCLCCPLMGTLLACAVYIASRVHVVLK
jgi:hypothetical protein